MSHGHQNQNNQRNVTYIAKFLKLGTVTQQNLIISVYTSDSIKQLH